MQRFNILVVDDDPGVLSLVSTILEQHDYTITAASDYRQAAACLNEREFDALVSDMYLNEHNGLSLLDHPAIHSADSAVIVMSGTAETELAVTAMRKGAHDFLTKPFTPEQVCRSVKQALHRREDRKKHAEHHRNLENLVQIRTAELSDALERLENAYDLTIEALGAALDLRDNETERHSRHVADLSTAIALEYGVTDPVFLQNLKWGALLHDIGKIGIPDSILNKPGPLTADERLHIQTHPELGYRVLAGIGFLDKAAEVVRYHHERYDGRGYPYGLAQDEIPLAARIFAVADTVDVLMNGRVYQDALPEEAVRKEIAASSGTHFDPAVVNAFTKVRLYVMEETA